MTIYCKTIKVCVRWILQVQVLMLLKKIGDSKMSERLVKVGVKGKRTLKQSSIERLDNLFANLDFSNEVFIHESCRCEYIKKSNVEAAKRRAESLRTENISPVKRKLRKSSSSSTLDESFDNSDFKWDINCLFCKKTVIVAEEKNIVCNKENQKRYAMLILLNLLRT